MKQQNIVLQGDVLARLQKMASNSVDCIVTSPPYWGLRDYGLPKTKWPRVEFTMFGLPVTVKAMRCCLGLEPTPMAFVGHLILIMQEAKRVLKPHGTLWINLGDSRAAAASNKTAAQVNGRTSKITGGESQLAAAKTIKKTVGCLKPKDMVGIPWMVAFALRDAGWYLRQDIIWSKPNPMPESCTDRCTKSHEHIFMFSKSKYYYYDAEAIKVPVSESFAKDTRHVTGSNDNNVKQGYEAAMAPNPKGPHRMYGTGTGEGMKANRRDVWTITTKPFNGAHFATFPEEIPELCIKAGSSEAGCCSACGKPYTRIVEKGKSDNPQQFNGSSFNKGKTAGAVQHLAAVGDKQRTTTTTGWTATCKCKAGKVPAMVLDLFDGAGTTRLVAQRLQRSATGIELNPAYIKISDTRHRDELQLFYNVEIK